jgi:O-antigen/teichoic acid export membrane protein
MTPIIFSTWEHKGRAETEKIVSHFSRYQLMFLIPGVTGLVMLSPRFMNIFVGPQFQKGVLATQIVAVGMFFLGIFNLTNVGLYVAKKTSVIASTMLAVGFVNIVLNVIFVPRYGYLAAGVTTFLSYLSLSIISYLQTKNILKWSMSLRSFIKISFATAWMGIAIYFLDKYLMNSVLALILMVVSGVLVYFIALGVTGEIKKEINFLLKRGIHSLKNGLGLKL